MWIAIVIIAAIALIAGLILGVSAQNLEPTSDDLVERINGLLPQTQCAQCGYPGCRPYAQAIASDQVAINLCPPGGQETIDRLAALLGRAAISPAQVAPDPEVAVIDETLCIGCGYCRSACPVDAIVGAHHLMHTVIASVCTGCTLCIEPCPVDCIRLRARA